MRTKRSNKDELAGVDSLIPRIIWTNYLLRTQKLEGAQNHFYRDNNGVILLKKYLHVYRSKRNKDINVHFLFKYRIYTKKLKLKWCITDKFGPRIIFQNHSMHQISETKNIMNANPW